MDVTRSQSAKSNQHKPESMDYYSDKESDISVPACNSRGVTIEIQTRRPLSTGMFSALFAITN